MSACPAPRLAPGPDRDLRVLDVSTGPAGAISAMLLADYGADVVKLEPPRKGPVPVDPGWLCWDRNKVLTAVDPADRQGRRELRRLLAATDVAVFDRTPGDLAADGWDGASLTIAFPNLIHAWLPPYGTGGQQSERPVTRFSWPRPPGCATTSRHFPTFPSLRSSQYLRAPKEARGYRYCRRPTRTPG